MKDKTRYGFCFRPEPRREGCSGYLHLWVADDRGETFSVPTPYDVSYAEWNAVEGNVAPASSSGDEARRHELAGYSESMDEDRRFVETVLKVLEREELELRAV